MIKSAAILKTKTLSAGKELRLQKRKLKKAQTVERKQNKVYFPSPIDASIVEVQIAPVDDAAPTRAELEAKAVELGIRFDGRTKDKKLGQLIQDRLSDNIGE